MNPGFKFHIPIEKENIRRYLVENPERRNEI